MDTQKYTNKDINEIANLVLARLNNNTGFFNSYYKKTEDILRNYNRMKKSIELLENTLLELKKEKEKIASTIVKSNKVVLKEKDLNYYYTDETLENRINELKQLIIKGRAELRFIDSCLSELEKDRYFDILKFWYMEGKTREWISEELDCDVRTITRNRKRLINELSYLLFPQNIIDKTSS